MIINQYRHPSRPLHNYDCYQIKQTSLPYGLRNRTKSILTLYDVTEIDFTIDKISLAPFGILADIWFVYVYIETKDLGHELTVTACRYCC